MKRSTKFSRHRSGVALVIILAFLVLLTVLVVAFFSRALTARQVSNSSADQTKAEVLMRSAASMIVGDLKQEIAAGSTAYTYSFPSANGTSKVTVYTPMADPAATPPVLTGSVVPWISGVPTPAPPATALPMPNLIRRSVRAGDSTYKAYPAYYNNPPPNRASSINSAKDVSANGRLVSPLRWNEHYLLPTAGTATSAPTTAFAAPDWVMISRERGPVVLPNVLASPLKEVNGSPVTIIGRTAYAIYDEGGLLDANVAGCPSNVTSADKLSGARGFSAFADLTALGLTPQQADNLVGWRNHATTQPSNGSLASNYTFTSESATNFYAYILGSPSGFLTTNTTKYTANGSGGFTANPMTFGSPPQMDQAFTSRQSLIRFWIAAGLDPSSLQYLGTFTRDLDQPNFVPLANPVPPTSLSPSTIINYPTPTASIPNPPQSPLPNTSIEPNPIVQNVMITNGANVGTPVIPQRFPLSKIALLANPTANTAAIKHYFGLTYSNTPLGTANTGEYQWKYSHPPATGTQPTAGTIMSLAQVAAMPATREAGYPQEPDFFELLQAAVLYGSLGSYSVYTSPTDTLPANGYMAGGTTGGGFNSTLRPSQFCASIIQMGANIIDQYDADDLPTVIYFNGDTFAGIENLPYFSELLFWPYRPKATIPASTPKAPIIPVGDPDQFNLAAFLLIELWNPHQNAANPPTASSLKLRFVIQPPGYPNSSLPAPANVVIKDQVPPHAILGTAVLPTQLDSTQLHVTFNNSARFQEPTILDTTNDGAACPENDWFQMTDSTPARAGLLLGVKNLPDYDLAQSEGLTDPSYHLYQTIGWDAGQSNYPTIFLQYSTNGTDWFNYQGTAVNNDRIYHLGISENQLSTTVNKPSPYAPTPVTTGYSWANYENVGSGSIEVSDPRTKSENSLFVGQSSYGLSIRPGTAGSGGNISGVGVIKYSIGNPQNYTFPIYGGGSTFKDYNGAIRPAYAGMYNENADDNTSGYHLINRYTAAHPGALNTYLVDPDGVLRPGDGFYGGDPMLRGNATSFATRPVLLNRPFRSVGEMGYAFRGWGPWKSINFFSQESADAGLLDYFTIDQAPVSAGKVNLNTRQSVVLQALLQGAYRMEPLATQTVDTLLPADASGLAAAIVKHTTATVAPAATSPAYIPGPLVSRADLVRGLLGDPAISNINAAVPGALDTIRGTAGTDQQNTSKMRREALVRALADVGTTRTWNLLIDIVAQTGTYPLNTTDPAKFVVQGEKHYWLHVALDRYTGAVIGQQMEPVNE